MGKSCVKGQNDCQAFAVTLRSQQLTAMLARNLVPERLETEPHDQLSFMTVMSRSLEALSANGLIWD